MDREVPEWFKLTDHATGETMKRIAETVQASKLPLQVRFLPMQAHWFILDSLLLANQANREGMHANALSLTRQCLEAISIVELGLSSHAGAADVLLKWEADKASPGELRRWLSDNVWPSYGSGLWSEPWAEFMARFARAIQPYAHYTTHLAKWQLRMHFAKPEEDGGLTAYAEWTPRAYDPQKATRITLFHAILTYALARIWCASSGRRQDAEFAALVTRLGRALGKSKYLDGHETDWDQQFWAMLWATDGRTVLE